MCSQKEIGELFLDKPDDMVLAYDDLVQVISKWTPFSIGASVHSVVVTSKKAWLIIKPMKSELDVKFYHDSLLESERIKKVTKMGKRYAHHIRIRSSEELNEDIYGLLKMGFECSLL